MGQVQILRKTHIRYCHLSNFINAFTLPQHVKMSIYHFFLQHMFFSVLELLHISFLLNVFPCIFLIVQWVFIKDYLHPATVLI